MHPLRGGCPRGRKRARARERPWGKDAQCNNAALFANRVGRTTHRLEHFSRRTSATSRLHCYPKMTLVQSLRGGAADKDETDAKKLALFFSGISRPARQPANSVCGRCKLRDCPYVRLGASAHKPLRAHVQGFPDANNAAQRLRDNDAAGCSQLVVRTASLHGFSNSMTRVRGASNPPSQKRFVRSCNFSRTADGCIRRFASVSTPRLQTSAS